MRIGFGIVWTISAVLIVVSIIGLVVPVDGDTQGDAQAAVVITGATNLMGIIGVLVGTYSSVAIAAPFVWNRDKDREDEVPTGAAVASGGVATA